MTDKKVTKEAPPTGGRRSRIPNVGLETLVQAAMKDRGEWVSIEKDPPNKNLYTSVQAKVGKVFCEVTEVGGKRIYLRIKREDEV